MRASALPSSSLLLVAWLSACSDDAGSSSTGAGGSAGAAASGASAGSGGQAGASGGQGGSSTSGAGGEAGKGGAGASGAGASGAGASGASGGGAGGAAGECPGGVAAVTVGCGSCVDASCCAESQACGKAEDCYGWLYCIRACPKAPDPQAGACQSECDAKYPAKDAAYAPLSKCVQDHCKELCGGGSSGAGGG